MPRKIVKNSEKQKKSKISSGKAKIQKRVFEETIEILDSDDDFVIPNVKVRGKTQEKVRNISIVEVEDFENFDLETSNDYNEAGDTDDVEELLRITPDPVVPVFSSKNDIEIIGGSSSGVNYNNYNSTVPVNDSDSKDVWKGLMQRMQQNQKHVPISSTSSFVKQGKGKGSKSKKPTVTLPKSSESNKGERTFLSDQNKTSCVIGRNNNSSLNLQIPVAKAPENAGSPPKKLKLEMNNDSDQTASTSTSPESISSETGIRNKRVYPDAKIPAMFLKPEEKAALAIAEKLERAKIQSINPNLVLSVFSEPLTFTVNETSDKFDGNVVKINDYVSTVDPYAGQKKKACPFYKKLPGTRFSVDAFNYGLIDGVDWYFLSHFHSDHYIGLTKKFCKTVICSPPTANLVRMKLYVEDKCIRQLQLNRPYVVNGVEVILIDANHCPGSVMFIFRLPNGITYFHTGDFRFTTDMLDNHYLQGLKIDNLYLDTTYCDPKYDFPTQVESIVELIAAVKRKLEFRPKTLIVCGSYVIGKERVYFSLAEALNLNVFVNTEKRRIINALENPRFSAYLTDNEDAGNIHVAQMFSIVPKFLSEYLAMRSSKYTNIIGIKPSGWQFSFAGSGTSIKSHFNDTVTIIGVPYSEHSSFSELQQFVCATKPRKIQPTVNVGSETKRTAMMNHINKWMESKTTI